MYFRPAMKSISELEEILVAGLGIYRDKRNTLSAVASCNEQLDGVSVTLAALLHRLLLDQYDDWPKHRWIDDSLLHKVLVAGNTVSIWGVMIWGDGGTTEQYTDPFYVELTCRPDLSGFTRYTFLFADVDNPAITYTCFNNNRWYWDKDFYSDVTWPVTERDWKYSIHRHS
ncbi:hypothetical protein B0I18_11564 [Taibaiella chishuiensis]|uniref:Uncharacterized protein n=2 Tax=Taibaiella chishuiensis TaxID=1434707 RepID=A0A2P8CT91_9BACT|nr:hypothetical protein B0I18_11564 [Taibaiella chishuiensis]